MIPPPGFARATTAALARIAAGAVRAIADEAPGDVSVGWRGGAIRLAGRALSARSLVDARLRDFAAIVRSGDRR